MMVIDFLVRSLAIVGAFAVGAWLTHAVWNRIARKWYKDQKLPDGVAWLARVLGGTVFAIIAYWAVHGGGGPGLGGTGGWFGGSGPYQPSAKDMEPTKEKEKGKDTGKQDKKEPPATVGTDTIRVEVLGDAPLEKLGGGKFDRERRYQIKGVPGMRTLDEVKQRIAAMRSSKPGLRVVEIVLYLDSPNRDRPQVAELVAYVSDLGVKLDFYEPGRRAPVE